MSKLNLVHRYRNNYTTHLSANPIAQMKKPQRSPLRLRFFICTLESASSAIGIVIYETMYWHIVPQNHILRYLIGKDFWRGFIKIHQNIAVKEFRMAKKIKDS